MKKLITVLLLLSLCGCSMAQLRQQFIGFSISDVKNSKSKQTQRYDISSAECIKQIKEMLINMGAIVREDKKRQFIVADNLQGAFRSSIDTTPVGILVTSLEANKSQVDVASENKDLAIFILNGISKRLNPKPEDQEAKK